MPTENNNIENKGAVCMQMFSRLGLDSINVRFLPAAMAYDYYLAGKKLDVSLLNL